MFSPTGYYAHYALTPSGLPYVLPVVSFDRDGDATVCAPSGTLAYCASDELLEDLGAIFQRVSPYGPKEDA